MKASKTFGLTEKEILKFPTGLHAVKSVVLDATDFGAAIETDGDRSIVPVGTILKLSATNTTQYVEYQGTGTIAGILGHPVDLVAASTGANTAVPLYFHECVFATSALVGFTLYASALVNDLRSCKFE